MHFQYITELYVYEDSRGALTTAKAIGEWLRSNVGREGSARESYTDYDWAWSLTTYSHGSAPVGIYFKDSECQLRFRLSFNICYGRAKS